MRWELLIIDEGSDDGTQNFVKKYFLINKRIRYFRRTFNGLISARNFGIKNATGSYITFINPLDEFKTNHIELRLNFMEENREVDLLVGSIDYEILKSEDPDYYEKIAKSDDKNSIISTSVLFGRRKVFELLNGFQDVEFAETDFIVRSLDYFKIQKIDYPTYIIHLK